MSRYIAIEGVIGVGKTTLARLLQPYFDATILLEVFEENPFLADFYSDKERYAFQTQLFFLLSRYQQQRQTVPSGLDKGNLISDYTFAKDELFAWLNLKDDELAMYGRVHSALGEKIPNPHLLIYLRASHEEVMRRIALRDRPYERDMDPNYIKELAAAYDQWLANISDVPVLTLDVTQLDFLSNKQDLEYVVEQINTVFAENGHPLADKQAQPRSGVTLPNIPAGPQSLAEYQRFHAHLDAAKRFNQDLFINFIALMEEMGEVASELIKVWSVINGENPNGRSPEDLRRTGLAIHKDSLSSELADLLAYVFKIANYADIDLEEAYLSKMRRNIIRDWEDDDSPPQEN